MEQYCFNSLLFSKLSDVLGISGAEIARRCGIKQQVLNRYQNSDIGISIQVLMKLCNALRMPVYYFVSKNNQYELPNREDATIPMDYWRPVTWNREAAELTFGDGEGKIYWKDLAVVMGVSSQKPHEYFALKKRFPIDCFFKACNSYGISPFRFLEDPNRDTDRSKRGGRAKTSADGTLRDDLAVLSRKVGDLTDAIDDLKEKYEALLKAHEQLAHRVQVNIDTISGGYIGNMGIAADPLAPPSDK